MHFRKRDFPEVVWVAACFIVTVPIATVTVPANVFADDGKGSDAVVGDWRGESLCQVKPSACHDEDSLYHFTRIEKKPGWFSLKADKIVDGQPVTMSTIECSYDGEDRSLECSFPKGVLQFEVQDNVMQGTMKLPDGTLWRKLSLKKVQ